MVAFLERTSPDETWILHGTTLRDVEDYLYDCAWRFFVEDESLRGTLRNNPVSRRDIEADGEAEVLTAASQYSTGGANLWIGVSGFSAGDTITFEVDGLLTVDGTTGKPQRIRVVFSRTQEFGKTRVIIN